MFYQIYKSKKIRSRYRSHHIIWTRGPKHNHIKYLFPYQILLEKDKMPNTTRSVAKGIPPRLHQAKSAAKKNKKKEAKAKQSKKRVADSDEENESSDSETVIVKKKRTKKRRTEESDSEVESTVEMVDDDEPAPPDVEEVNDGHGNQLSDEQEVSINVYGHNENSQKII